MATAYAWYWQFNMGKGHDDRLRLVLAILYEERSWRPLTPGIGNLIWGKVMKPLTPGIG
jgi:hypothetical protein